MGVLSHVLEAEGLSTVGLSLSLEQTARIAPPRALFVDFPFGRPLGIPGNKKFQQSVLEAAFALLTYESGPVLESFPHSLTREGERELSCTIPPSFDPNLPPEVAEAHALQPAYNRQLDSTGRTALGRVLRYDEIADAIWGFIRVREGSTVADAGLPGPASDCALDIRAYFEEASLALSGDRPRAHDLQMWFYRDTATGRLILDVQDILRARGAPRDVWFYLAPFTLNLPR